ncbi:MAG: hypothetical protein R3F61_13165 [Myxococcota bacterium]
MRTLGPWALAAPAFLGAIAAGFVVLGIGVSDPREALLIVLVGPILVALVSVLSIAFGTREQVVPVEPTFADRADGFSVEWLDPADYAARIWSVAAAGSLGWSVPGVCWMGGDEAIGFTAVAAMASFTAAAAGVFLVAPRFLFHRVELVGRVVVVDGKRVVLEEPLRQVDVEAAGPWSRLVLRGTEDTVHLVGDRPTLDRIAVRLRSLPRAPGSASDVPDGLRDLQDAR